MTFTNEFWIQIVIYGASFGTMYGAIITRLKYIEKKQDKHNGLIERMVKVEQATSSAHHRLDEIKRDMEK